MNDKSTIVNQFGIPVKSIAKPQKQKGMGLYGNIFGQQNSGKFRDRYYTLSDTSQGLDRYSRELLVRWSREMVGQLPIVSSAIKILSQFSVDRAFLPDYIGKNEKWGKIATDWIIQDFYPNCCTRGASYDYQTILELVSQTIDTDGDILLVFGEDRFGFPLIQLIPSHRLTSGADGSVITKEGKFKDNIISDGVVYTKVGKAVGYCVQNSGNLVNSMIEETPEIIFSTNESRLLFDPRYLDKNRGIPAIASAVLQAISIQQLDDYLVEKIKMESLVALVEKNKSGEAPQEFQDTMQALLSKSNNNNNNNNSVNPLFISPNQHAIQVINGPEIRYVKSDGGDISSLSSNTPGNETAEYMTRLESQILMCIGVPHQLVFSTQKIGGRVTGAAAEIFRKSISKRQLILENMSKLTIGWALSKAIKAGFIPENNDENLLKIFNFTKPEEFTLDAKYDNQIQLDNLTAGICTLNDVSSKLYGKTSSELFSEQADEQIYFYNKAKEVASITGVDINIVISNWKNSPMKTTNTIQTQTQDSPQE